MNMRDLDAIRRAVEENNASWREIEESNKRLGALLASSGMLETTKTVARWMEQLHSVERTGRLGLGKSFAQLHENLGLQTTREAIAGLAAHFEHWDSSMSRTAASVADALKSVALFPDTSSIARVTAGFLGVQNLEAAKLTSLAAGASVAYLSWETLGDRLGISARARWTLQHSTMRLQRRYADLVEAEHDAVGASGLDTDASVSVLAHGQSLRVITTADTTDTLVVGIRVDVVKATFEVVEDWLEDSNPQWAEMLRGARERAVLRGSDWPRHWASSYRQLFKNVLHAAAPSAVVRQWVTEKSDLDAKGFPKRRTKVRWLCRNEPETQRRFLVEDIDSALGMLGVLEEAVHEDDTDIIESEFHWLSLRIEKAMHDILRLWRRG